MRLPLLSTVLLLALLPAARAMATAHYVYHERSTGDVLQGASTTTCGGAQPYVSLLAPTTADAVTVRFKVEYQGYTTQVRLAYTTDGSAPSVAHGVGSGTTQVVVADYQCTYTPYADTIDVARAVIPAQAQGDTRVRYVVSAWHEGGGDEIFANSGTCDAGCTPCTTSSCAEVFEYTVQGPLADAGSGVDSSQADDAAVAADSAVATDAATGQDQQVGVDSATLPDSASAPDLATASDVTAPLDAATGTDAATAVDAATAPDTAVAPDQATAPDHAVRPDTAVASDAAIGPDTAAGVDRAVAVDAASVEAGACTPGCQDLYYRVVCGADGQSIVVPCSADTTCQGGVCVRPDAGTAQAEEAGCGCRAALAGAALPAGLVLVAAGLLRRRRA